MEKAVFPHTVFHSAHRWSWCFPDATHQSPVSVAGRAVLAGGLFLAQSSLSTGLRLDRGRIFPPASLARLGGWSWHLEAVEGILAWEHDLDTV